MISTNENLKAKIIIAEKKVATLISSEVEAVRKSGGDSLADEMLMSITALFAARGLAYLHVVTTEPIDSIKKRFLEAFEYNLKSAQLKMAGQVETQLRKS